MLYNFSAINTDEQVNCQIIAPTFHIQKYCCMFLLSESKNTQRRTALWCGLSDGSVKMLNHYLCLYNAVE